MHVRFPRLLTQMTLFAGALVALVGFALGRAQPALAGGVVTTCDESSLRAALAGGGSVTFNCPGSPVISLGSQIVITAPTTVNGVNGGNTVALSGSARIFSVTQNIALTLTNLIVENGTDMNGGCIFANGPLFLDNVELMQCHAASGYRGGALYVSSVGNATLVNSRVHDNAAATLHGGGIYSLGALSVMTSSLTTNSARQGGAIDTEVGATVLLNVTFSGNQVTGAGGALFHATGSLAGTQTTFNNNTSGSGGAIWNDSGILTLDHATFNGNSATHTGGGIHVEAGPVSLNNAAFDGNTADFGGGIFSKALLTLNASTFNNNHANTAAGGIRNDGTGMFDNLSVTANSAGTTGGGIDSGGNLTLTNSTLSGNTAGDTGGGLIGHLTTNLSNVTINGNHAPNGAGFNNQNTATLNNVTINSNVASNTGGGIWSNGTLTLNNATVNSNSASSDGGGILIFNNASTANLTNVTLNNNKVSTSGGAIYSNGSLTLMQVYVDRNTAGEEGGGVWSNGTLTLKNSSITQNTGKTGGGLNNQGTANLSNATVSGNLAVNGGGMFSKGPATLVNVTLSNRSYVTGTSDNFFLFDGQLTLQNTIVNAEGDTHVNCITVLSATHVSLGHNIANDLTCGLTSSGDQQGQEGPSFPILLGSLGLYGGSTLSMLPYGGSAAINHGDNGACAAAPVNNLDQRGMTRPVGGTCDVGAVERQPGDADLMPGLYLPIVVR